MSAPPDPGSQVSVAKRLARARRSGRDTPAGGAVRAELVHLGQRLGPASEAVLPPPPPHAGRVDGGQSARELHARIEQLEREVDRIRERLNRSDAEAIAHLAAAEILRQIQTAPAEEAETLLLGEAGSSDPEPPASRPTEAAHAAPRRRGRTVIRWLGAAAVLAILLVPAPP